MGRTLRQIQELTQKQHGIVIHASHGKGHAAANTAADLQLDRRSQSGRHQATRPGGAPPAGMPPATGTLHRWSDRAETATAAAKSEKPGRTQ